jgi:hypothetical protein
MQLLPTGTRLSDLDLFQEGIACETSLKASQERIATPSCFISIAIVCND